MDSGNNIKNHKNNGYFTFASLFKILGTAFLKVMTNIFNSKFSINKRNLEITISWEGRLSNKNSGNTFTGNNGNSLRYKCIFLIHYNAIEFKIDV